jgi:DNA-binding GntR family transcriptional regulator
MTSQKTQATTLYDRLRDDIVYGRLQPGSRLKIEVLQERYSTGLTPLREALNLLVSTGLVERLEQRGFRVAEISLGDFEEVLWTRCFVEERALRESIAHADAAWEERVVVALHHLRKHPLPAQQSDDGAWERVHAEFHRALIAGCRSRLLLQFCNQLYDANRRYRHIARLVPQSRAGAFEEHEQIGEAALARKADQAAHLLIDHYNRTGELLRMQLRKYKESA